MAANEEFSCVTCGQMATKLVVDTLQNTEQYFCSADAPQSPTGELSPRFRTKRSRLGPDNHLSRRLRAPQESEEHLWFRILGSWAETRYYLSMITGIDQFEIWDDKFEQNLLEYVVSLTSPAARQFFEPLQTDM